MYDLGIIADKLSAAILSATLPPLRIIMLTTKQLIENKLRHEIAQIPNKNRAKFADDLFKLITLAQRKDYNSYEVFEI